MGPRICISNTLPGDPDAVSPWATVESLRSGTPSWARTYSPSTLAVEKGPRGLRCCELPFLLRLPGAHRCLPDRRRQCPTMQEGGGGRAGTARLAPRAEGPLQAHPALIS